MRHSLGGRDVSFLAPDYLDRDLPLSVDDRKEVRRQAWKLWLANRWNLLLYVVVIAAINVLGDLALREFRTRAGQMTWWHWLIAALIFFAVLYGCIMILQRWRFAPLARRIVREQGFNICHKCGRWLREETACPRHGASA